jgi:hypothetical protein
MKIIICDTKNSIESIEVSKYEKVSDLKEKIKIKKGINFDIELHFVGEILEDSQTLDYYDIEENNIIVYTGTFRVG